MFIDDHHYDCIIVGSGAGGSTLASELSRQGKWVPVSYTHLTLPTNREV